MRRILLGAAMVTAFVSVGSVRAASDLNPAAISIKLPKDIPWVENEKAGSANAVLVGDPSKPGFYAVMTKWHGGHMSRPHFHPNDRYITVLSGTWYVGTGSKYSPDTTTPIPAGSFRYARREADSVSDGSERRRYGACVDYGAGAGYFYFRRKLSNSWFDLEGRTRTGSPPHTKL